MIIATVSVCSAHGNLWDDDMFSMHIDINDQGWGHVSDIIVYQGDSSKIKAEPWIQMTDSYTVPWTDVYMTIYNKYGDEVHGDKAETNWLGNAYFHTPSNLPLGTYRIKICSYAHAVSSKELYNETWANLIVKDPVKDNPNAEACGWIINARNLIQGQHIPIVALLNTTHINNYKNQTPDENSELGNVSYVVFDNAGDVVKNSSVSLKLTKHHVIVSCPFDVSDLNPGTYRVQLQCNGNQFIKPSTTETNFTVYSKDSQLSVSNESTLNVTQGNDAQVIALINNAGIAHMVPCDAPKANVTFTVFDQNYNVVTGDTFTAKVVDGHYVAYMDWNTGKFKPGTYKLHMAVNGNPFLTDCDTWTNITIYTN